MLKQNQFNSTEATLLTKKKFFDNVSGGGTIKNSKSNQKAGGVMSRRFTLLALTKKYD